MYSCEECGFEHSIHEGPKVAQAILPGVAEVAAILRDGDPSDLRTRRDPSVWSPLEYGCHLRDVLLVQRERVLAARYMERPSPDPMGRDERVEYDGYAEQEPDDVARQLTDAGHLFANVLARLRADDWPRTVMYNYPTRSERSLRWMAVHTLHEVQHHLLDVKRQLSS